MAGVEEEIVPAAAADDRPAVRRQWAQARPMLDPPAARIVRIDVAEPIHQHLTARRIEAGVIAVEFHRARDAQTIAQRHDRNLAAVIGDRNAWRSDPTR